MQDVTATTLAADRTARRAAVIKFYVRWGEGAWVDESAYVLKLTGSLRAIGSESGISAVGNSVANKFTVTLSNSTDRFTEWNTAGALYSYLAAGAWKSTSVRILLGFKKSNGTADGVYVLKGNLEEIAEQSYVDGTITFTCYDRSVRLLQHLGKGALSTGKRADEILTDMLTLVNADYRPETTFDKGLFVYPFAVVDQQSLWNQMKLIAGAEGGRLYFTSSGDADTSTKIVFENAQHLLKTPHNSHVAEFSIASFADLLASGTRSDYYNHVVVNFTALRPGPMQELWSAGEAFPVAPGQTIVINALADLPVYEWGTMVSGTDWIATTESGTRVTTGITVTATTFGQQVKVTVANASAYQVRIRRLRLWGRALEPGDKAYVEWPADSESHDFGIQGKRTAPPIDNQYIQSRAHAMSLAKMLHYRWSTQRIAFRVTDIVAMPWLEVGDRVRITESIEGGLTRDCFVEGITFRGDAGGLWMDLDLLPVTGLFQYDGTYFVMGTNWLGEDTDAKGRYFH